ncbi:hypothetical protein BBF96_04580 [Anoxybacter fermentans]|uniref:Fumarate lyase N-terminal domain-containing protein n=1 Tax=Anoxybacter fermentans TaxID=1323375 RepID=A0A3Q9HPS5_9FIRM|nr:lyase family protein [Anoxybacter fermentans]AZR72729.1 hypothetical protein BBF96_04580 [Anoxybacter fermentans]
MEDIIGREIAGDLHIGRSRNDIDITLYCMALSERVLQLMEWICNFEVLLQSSRENNDTVMPDYTYNQRAQPTILNYFSSPFNGIVINTYKAV